MRLLLDTHVLLWVLTDDSSMSSSVKKLISSPENEIYYSIVSPWEIEIKHENHPDLMPINGERLIQLAESSGFIQLGISDKAVKHMSTLNRKPHTPVHKDPFDRMMICQAAVSKMRFITDDERVAKYTDSCIFPVKRASDL